MISGKADEPGEQLTVEPVTQQPTHLGLWTFLTGTSITVNTMELKEGQYATSFGIFHKDHPAGICIVANEKETEAVIGLLQASLIEIRLRKSGKFPHEAPEQIQ